MVKLDVSGCKPFIASGKWEEYLSRAKDARAMLQSGNGKGNDFLGWRHLPSATQEPLLAQIDEVCADWRSLGVDWVVAIGIGGSYLGAKCVIEALGNSFSAYRKDAAHPVVVFAGQNLSSDYLSELLEVSQGRNLACVVISKSGTTTEPAVAFRAIREAMVKRYGASEAARRTVAITDTSRGALKTLSTQEGYRTFVVPDDVGGRFSVLSPVGLVPIALAGHDIRALLAGAKEMEQSLWKTEDNPAVRYAAARNCLFREAGKQIEVLVSYQPKLAFFAEWWKQLYGESEGKDGTGIFPASVSNTADLHSMGQFIQQGSRILFETVLHVEKTSREPVTIDSDPQNLDQLNFLAGKTVAHCNDMAELGTRLAHMDGGVPQLRVSVEKADAAHLGALIYFFEYACGVSAYLLGVNPFDQPGVEAYKKNMFALLEKPGYEEMTLALQKRL